MAPFLGGWLSSGAGAVATRNPPDTAPIATKNNDRYNKRKS
jgi:hypothetical protein